MATTDVTKVKWVALGGCIFTEQLYRHKADLGKEYHSRQSIAFNVGQKVAEHIVNLHNASLESKNAS